MSCCRGARVAQPQKKSVCKCGKSLEDKINKVVAKFADTNDSKVAVHVRCDCGIQNKIWVKR